MTLARAMLLVMSRIARCLVAVLLAIGLPSLERVPVASVGPIRRAVLSSP
ncbi:MAG: hypothetical protein WAP47_16840 [Candidatus Rokuibacteriota bacterium]